MHKELIYARISGYGQTGPKAHLPGYASVCEAYSGFRWVQAVPDALLTLIDLTLMAGVEQDCLP